MIRGRLKHTLVYTILTDAIRLPALRASSRLIADWLVPTADAIAAWPRPASRNTSIRHRCSYVKCLPVQTPGKEV